MKVLWSEMTAWEVEEKRFREVGSSFPVDRQSSTGSTFPRGRILSVSLKSHGEWPSDMEALWRHRSSLVSPILTVGFRER